MRKKSLTTPLASEAWKLMFRILMASSGERTASLGKRDLTPNDARGLWSIDTKMGRPIGELARDWQCDPSNATFIVGRLERAGLARREAAAEDARVKLVFLTEKGAAMRAELQKEYHQPPPEVLRLSQSDLRELIRILKKMSG